MLQDRRRTGFCLLLLLLLWVPRYGIAMQLPLGWPHGWSKPHRLLTGDRLGGYSSVALSDGNLAVARVISGDDSSRLVVDRVEVGSREATPLYELKLEGLREFVLLADEEAIYLATLSLRDDDGAGSTWIFALTAISTSTVQSQALVVAFERTGTASDIAVVTDGNGQFYWAWSGSEVGLRNVNLLVHDHKGNTLLIDETGGPQTADLAPILSIGDDGKIFIMYYRDNSMFSELVYQGIDPEGGVAGQALLLGRASLETPRPMMLMTEPGKAVVLWAQSVRGFGRSQSAVIYYGELLHHGEWLMPLKPLAERYGNIVHMDSKGSHSGITAVWLEDRAGSLQVEFAEIDLRGNVIDSGPVTQGSQHRFSPRIHHIGDNRVVLFSEYANIDFVLHVVDDASPSKAPLSYWLGLDTAFPLGDAAFRYVTLLGSSLGLGALAIMSILFSVLTVTLLTSLNPFLPVALGTPRMLLLFVLLAMFKRSGGLLYYGAVLIPGISGLVIMAGSAVFSLVSMRFLSQDMHETLGLAVAGYLFVVADFFGSLFVGGLGL